MGEMRSKGKVKHVDTLIWCARIQYYIYATILIKDWTAVSIVALILFSLTLLHSVWPKLHNSVEFWLF